MTGDIKDFYLGTPLDRYEYMRIPINMIPDDIVKLYGLADKIVNGFVYAEIRRGMYGLPQAGRLANEQLKTFLAPHGYRPAPVTPGLWLHDTRPIQFSLVVDDFGVKYSNVEDAEHLMTALKQHYKVSEDWTGSWYCGLTLVWDYKNRTCDVSMPGYVERALQRFKHTFTATEDSPHAWQKPTYGAKVQYASQDSTPNLNAADQKHVQTVLGTFLYYARAVDSTLLASIGTLATQQTNGTKATLIALTQLLNYCTTHPNAVIRYHASGMVLWVDSDASYLSAPKGRSRMAGYHYLSDAPADPSRAPTATDPHPPPNGAVEVTCQIMREVLSSAAEAELGGLFLNGKTAVPIRTTLEELGHPQPPTPLQTDNSTAAGIANDNMKQKRSKAMDMRFYWIRDRVRQKQFHVYWRPGTENKADYFSKHHPDSHHCAMCSQYLHVAPGYYDALSLNDTDPASPVPASLLDAPFLGEGVLISPSRDGVIGSSPEVRATSASTDSLTVVHQ